MDRSVERGLDNAKQSSRGGARPKAAPRQRDRAPTAADVDALVAEARSLRGNGPAVAQLQRTHGNAFVSRLLEERATEIMLGSGGEAPVEEEDEEHEAQARANAHAQVGRAVALPQGGRAQATNPLASGRVTGAMREAWTDSEAESQANRHEEGGYIVRRADGSLGVERWPRGQGASITPPARDAQGRFNGLEVLGEFHTHPNPPVDETGQRWNPGPHPGDTNAIAAENYPGDSYIISAGHVYVVHNDGTSGTVGRRGFVLGFFGRMLSRVRGR